MKKLILCLLLIISLLCACNKTTEEGASLADGYRSVAQEYIDAGDLDTAIAALEEGIERTGDASLKKMLAQLQEKETTAPTTQKPTTAPTTAPTTEPTTQTSTEAVPNNLQYGLTWETKDTDFIEYMYRHAIFDDGTSTIVGQATVDRPWNDPVWSYCISNGEKYLMVKYSVVSEDGYTFYEVIFREINQTRAEVVEFWCNGVMLDAQDTESRLKEWEFCWKTAENNSASKDLTHNFDATDWYRINIFLSNFSEQYFYSLDHNDAFSLVHFAYLHNLINNHDALWLNTDTDRYLMDTELTDQTLLRFFGHTVEHHSHSKTYSSGYTYTIDYGTHGYYFLAGAGEFYGFLSIANRMYKNSDGTYKVFFDVYAVDAETYLEYGVPRDYYYMTSAEAANHWALEYCYSGTAQVRDYDGGSYQSYQLLSYDAN